MSLKVDNSCVHIVVQAKKIYLLAYLPISLVVEYFTSTGQAENTECKINHSVDTMVKTAPLPYLALPHEARSGDKA